MDGSGGYPASRRSEHACQSSDSLADIGLPHARVAEHETGARRGLQKVLADSVDPYALRGRRRDDALFRYACARPQHDVRATALACQLDAIAEVLLNRREQHVTRGG